MPTLLDREFFARATVEVAAALVGCRLVADGGGAEEVVADIVEVEAYLGLEDPASHAFRGPTRRASLMFGEPGHLYVYLSYGVHCCANLVTEPVGTAGAVLLRAAALMSGLDVVSSRRPAVAGAALLRGPGNLCRALGIGLDDNGLDVCAPGARVCVLAPRSAPPLVVDARVGISSATEWPLRFAWADHPAVSRPRPPRRTADTNKGPALRPAPE